MKTLLIGILLCFFTRISTTHAALHDASLYAEIWPDNNGDAVVAGATTGGGNLTNTGTLRIFVDVALGFSGSFTKTGIFDIMTWSGTLPAGATTDRRFYRVSMYP